MQKLHLYDKIICRAKFQLGKTEHAQNKVSHKSFVFLILNITLSLAVFAKNDPHVCVRNHVILRLCIEETFSYICSHLYI